MELTIKEYDERLEYSQKNRSKVRKDLVKQDIDSDTCTDRFTPLYRWQTVYLRADYKLTHTEVCVYAHIYGTKYCYETTERISENTACSVKGVRTAVESLIKKGLIFAETDTIVVNGIPRKQRVLSVNTEIAEKYEKSSMKHKRGSVGYDNDLFVSLVKKVKAGEMTARKAMEELNMKPNTFYRRVKELEGE